MENSFKHRKEQIDEYKSNFRKRFNEEPSIKEMPQNVFLPCDKCGNNILYDEFKENLFVCPRCNHHARIGAYERISQIIDDETFEEINKEMELMNPDFIGYEEKLVENQNKTGLKDACVTGVGNIFKMKVAIAVLDANFMMGSMGVIVGEKITQLIEEAMNKRLPLIIFSASGGARMQEGILSLMQMAKTSAALARFKKNGLFISVLTHPTTGGVSASFASLGDITIAEPKALIGFAGKRVIEKTINEVLPKEFQTAEFLLEKGYLDLVVSRKEMKDTIAKILKLHGVII